MAFGTKIEVTYYDANQSDDQIRRGPGQGIWQGDHERVRLRAVAELHPVRHLLRHLPVEHLHGFLAAPGHGAGPGRFQERGAPQPHRLALRFLLRLHLRVPAPDSDHRHYVCAEAAGDRGGHLSKAIPDSRAGEGVLRDGPQPGPHHRNAARHEAVFQNRLAGGLKLLAAGDRHDADRAVSNFGPNTSNAAPNWPGCWTAPATATAKPRRPHEILLLPRLLPQGAGPFV